MNTQVFTSFNATDFKSMLQEAVKEAVKSEFDRLGSQPPESQKQFLTRKEAALLLGVTITTLHTWSKSGVVPCHKVGTRIRYRFNDLQNALRLNVERGRA